MATYLLEDADVSAVFFRTGAAGSSKERLRLAPYLLVTYDDGTSGIVPYPVRGFGAQADYTVRDFEVDRIEIYDGNPYEFTQMGHI